MKKKFLAALLGCAMLALTLSGCSSSNSGSSQATKADTTVMGTETLDDGREVNGYAEGDIGETIQTSWFAFTVNSVDFADEYAGRKPAEGNEFVIANITVANTFSDTLPMGNYDFQIQWGEGDEDYGYGLEEIFADTMMPYEYELEKGDTLTGDVVYEIPKVDNGSYSISFLEIYEDDQEGNVFFVFFSKDSDADLPTA